MIENKTKRLVLAGLFLAVGLILPYVTSHAYGIQGTIILPMHLPVMLCAFFCGPLLGALCGLILPVLNSILTGMPVLYPMAVIMTVELFTYGIVIGFISRLFKHSTKIIPVYASLISAMVSGRILSGLTAALLLIVTPLNPAVAKYSVLSSVITGIPGIIIQLILVPSAVCILGKKATTKYDAKKEALRMIAEKSATCVIVKDNKIIKAETTKGIAYIMSLYEDNLLEDAFIADTVVGKAAAMIFSLAKLKECYSETMSVYAYDWLTSHNIKATYTNLVPEIENRTKTGNCPMESTVKDINDEETAYKALKEKLEELRKSN